MKQYWIAAKVQLKDFVKSASQEAKETSEAAQILRKYARERNITPEEKIKLRQQIYDIFKCAGIGVPLILIPGASVILIVLLKVAKKHKIDLLPSSFNKDDSK